MKPLGPFYSTTRAGPVSGSARLGLGPGCCIWGHFTLPHGRVLGPSCYIYIGDHSPDLNQKFGVFIALNASFVCHDYYRSRASSVFELAE